MTEPAKDFWAGRTGNLLEHWPKDASGAPENRRQAGHPVGAGQPGGHHCVVLKSCGIPAFLNGSLGKVLGDSPPRAWRSGCPPPGWRRPRRCWTPPRKRHRRSRTDGPASVPNLHNRRYLSHGFYERNMKSGWRVLPCPTRSVRSWRASEMTPRRLRAGSTARWSSAPPACGHHAVGLHNMNIHVIRWATQALPRSSAPRARRASAGAWPSAWTAGTTPWSSPGPRRRSAPPTASMCVSSSR